ncbi:MAG TPA: hypothetical protein VLT16_04010 [Candidatus Limnocylindrales bacterium]|nr:hypothetical protein [Candidatus Limnocylindrales bacterium]
MGQDPHAELQDLTIVNSFYVGLLEQSLGHAVPVPVHVKNGAGTPEAAAQTVADLKNWLDLLDLAMTPPLVRDSLKTTTGNDTAHALLRYFVVKASPRSGDRDKTDCVITYLFRNPPQTDGPPVWQRPEVDSSYFFISQAALGFQSELYRAFKDLEYSPLPQEHSQILHEFEYLYQELEEFRHFDQIMDSNIVQRVRELKQSLGRSFYHPDALAQIAVWNDVFGRKFDESFHDAAKQIKTFAENVQKEGGSILSRVEGDITVKQLAEVETGEILAEDYQSAQDEFRKVSKFKKAVDSKRPARTASTAPAYIASVTPPPQPRPVIPTHNPVPMPLTTAETAPHQPIKAEVLAVPPSQAVQNAVQEGKVHSAKESIKEHVRTAPAHQVPIIQVKMAKLTLSAAEVEAFKADYQGEKSFRSDYANVMMNLVAYLSRMIVEVDEYNQKAASAYLWKPHADALGYLLSTLERLRMEAESVMAVARARGLQDKAAALKTSLDKLRDYAKTVSQTLQAADQGSSGK